MRTHTKFNSYLLAITVILSMTLQSVQPVQASPSIVSQNDGTRISYSQETGKVSFIGADPSKPIVIHEAQLQGLTPASRGVAFIEPYAKQFGLRDAAQELTLKSNEVNTGHDYYRYQQTYHGIPVMAGEMIVNANDKGELLSLSGEVSPNLDIDITPAISANEAQSIALIEVAKWYQSSSENFAASQPELWIYDSRLMGGNAYPVSLVWRLEITTKDESRPLDELVLISAQTGEVALHFNQVDTAWSAPKNNPTAQTETPVPPAPVEPTSVPQAAPSSPQRDGPTVTWYVAPDGADVNDCLSAAAPCATIQQAVNYAFSGDSIWVAKGTYTNPGGNEIIMINKNVDFYGGWDPTFSTQVGFSVIDGNNLQQDIKLGDDGNQGVTTTIERFIVKNSAGSGISSWSAYYYTSDHLTLRNSAAINNSGDGIRIEGAINLANVTVSNNMGGGIDHQSNLQSDIVDINNATIANNIGPGLSTQYQVNIQNTILSGNTTTDGNPLNCYIPFNGTLTSGGYNIIGNMTGCKLTAATGDKLNTDPRLLTLLPALGYIPLSPNSPAIDAGNNPTCSGTTDQRGVARADGNGDTIITCDIGAFEYIVPGTASEIVLFDGDDQHVTPNSAFPTQLKVAAVDNLGNPVSGVEIAFTSPPNGPSAIFVDTNTNTSLPVATSTDGIATSPQFAANGELGIYNMLASSAIGNITFNEENVLWYVAPGGDDTNDCKSAASPCSTINGALHKSFQGNKILVAQGVYFEDLLWLQKNIAISGGWDADTFTTQTGLSTIDGQNAHRLIKIDLGATVEIEKFILTNGYVSDIEYGGGISNSGSLTLEDTIVKNNQAGSAGGIANGGPLLLINSSIINNSAIWSGGGIYNMGQLTATNSTIGENVAAAGGGINTGGTFSLVSVSITLNFTTISGNKASDGGGIKQYSGTVGIQNSILAGNTSTGNGPDCSGSFTSSGHNIIGTVSGCSITLLNSDKNTAPQLGMLIKNTGYYPISPTSPAIDAADNTCAGTVDRRNLLRPQGITCDIGSYEYKDNTGSASSIFAGSGSGQYIYPGNPFPQLLKAIVIDNYGSPVSGVQVTFTAPSSGASGTFADTANATTTSTTDEFGVATASPFTSNNEFGNFMVDAAAAGIPFSADFALTNGGWLVAPGGNDSSDCHTPWTACATVNGALSKATSGETVRIAVGTYTGTKTGYIVNISKNITLSGGWSSDFTSQAGSSIIDGENLGWGVNVEMQSTATIEKIIIRNCVNTGISNDGKLTITDSTITGNATAGQGDGISSWTNGDLTINNSVISNNHGIGINNSGKLVLNNTTVAANAKSGVSSLGTAAINSSQIYDNQESGITNGGSLFVNNSTIFNNTNQTGYYGGGIRNYGTATILNSTISNNRAYHGGGIYSSGNTTINNSTITANAASYRGGGIRQSEGIGTFTIQNTLIADNTAVNDGPDCYGITKSNGHNLVSSTTGCTITSSTGDKFNVNAKLGAFLVKQGYYTIYLNSPAIDSGNPATCLSTDQRGASRFDGDGNGSVICDIGAYEYTSAGPATQIAVASGSNQHAIPGKPFALPLLVVALDNQGTPVKNVSITYSAPESGPSGVFSNNYFTTTKVTDSGGIANSGIFTANQEFGAYKVSAVAAGIPQLIEFDLKNNIWFVAPTGNNAAGCDLPSTPCATIQGVLNKVDFYSGETVRVGVGIYDSGNFALAKTITISGGWNAEFTQQIGASTIEDGLSIPEGVTANLDRLTIQNTASYGIKSRGNLNLINSTIRLNRAGIINDGQASIINTTISQNSDNSSEFVGAGIWNGNSTVTLINSTVTDNHAMYGGGLYQRYDTTGTIIISNSIIAGNTAHTLSGYNLDCEGTVISIGYNLIGNVGNILAPICKITMAGTDRFGYYEFDPAGTMTKDATLYPKLAPMQNIGNGIWAQPVTLDSIALNSGNPITPGTLDDHACPVTDQRGITRPQGYRCDIGAYEYTVYQSTPVRISTYNTSHAWTLPGTLICQSNDASCATLVPGAWTAHVFAYGTVNFYLTTHGRNSVDNNGMEIISTIQYGTGYDNAFWNHQQMVYGDAHAFSNADDVVAHELTHGVTDYESGLFYYYQSGAINESFSDLWGEAYDQIGNPTAADTPAVKWLIGEDVTGVGATRNMSNPPQFNDPDKMTSALYVKDATDNGGVHTNSGVNNKAVALMVDGGAFNGRTISPLGWPKVLTIYYEAQTHLLTSGADYLDLYNALYQACLNEVGITGILQSDCQEVFDATYAVEMNLEPTIGFNPNVSECPNNLPLAATIFSDDFESGIDGWILSASMGQDGWQLSSGDAISGTHMLWADDAYPMSVSSAQISLWVPNGTSTYLRFSHSYGFEYGFRSGQYEYYDGSLLEYSTDDGVTWNDAASLFDAGKNYTGHIYNPGNLTWANPFRGKSAFVGESHGYVDSRYNLTSLAGRHVTLRWSTGTDINYYLAGWKIDDVKISACGSMPSTFFDVPQNYWAWKYIESIYNASITGGCSTSPLMYCPGAVVTRAQMAVFLGRGIHGSSFIPPAATGTVFLDIPSDHWAATWIEQFALDGITGGCSNGNYCPNYPVTRDQMAVFLLRAEHGKDYAPTAATGTMFGDVPVDYWAAAWIEQLATEGITGGCGDGNYCPGTPVTRDQMAVFLQRTFGFPLP